MKPILFRFIRLVAQCVTATGCHAVVALILVLFNIYGISDAVYVALTSTTIVAVEVFDNGMQPQISALVSCFIAFLAVIFSWKVFWPLAYAIPDSMHAIMMIFMTLAIGLEGYFIPSPARRTIVGLRRVFDLVYYQSAIWDIIITGYLTRISDKTVRPGAFLLLCSVASMNSRSMKKTIILVTCQVFRLYFEALGIHSSSDQRLLHDHIRIASRNEEGYQQGNQGR